MRLSPKRKALPTVSLARVDPSRTGTLRRGLSAAVGRMWGELKADLITLIAREDALGGKIDPTSPFALNAYCPTGPGGGVDNTCPPASKRGPGWTYQRHVDATSGTLPDGRKVRFVKARTGARYVLRMVDPKVLDREWSRDRGFYVPPGGGGAEIQGRRERFDKFLDTGRPVEATVVYLNKIRGGVSIDDGRHRFSVLRDKGIDRVGITVTREQADELDALLGTHPLTNTRWKHAPDSQKVEAFRRWLRQEMGLKVRGKVNDDVWRSYVTRAFQQGGKRARGQVTKGRRTGRTPSPQEQILAGGQAFHPASYERVEGLVGRVLTELDGLTTTTEIRAVRALADGLAKGQHPREIAKKLAEEVDIARTRAELIVRTETIRAHAEGQLDEMEKMGVQDVGVEVEFLSAADDRRCPQCAKLQGTVFSIKKARGVIPVHPNCLPGDSLVLSRSGITATSKRWYDGDLVVIRTAGNRVLRCTPNHPVLTDDRRWVGAGLLNVGDHVVCDGGDEWEPIGQHNHENGPVPIQYVAEPAIEPFGVSAVEVPITAPDFHGDGTEGDIAVVRTYGLLGDAVGKTTVHQHLPEGGFVSCIGAGLSDLSGRGRPTESIVADGASSYCVMCRSYLPMSLVVGHLRPLEEFGLTTTSGGDATVREDQINGPSGDVELLGDSINGLPIQVHRHNLVRRKVRGSADGCVVVSENSDDDLVSDAELAGKVCNGATGPVFSDEIVSVFVERFSGHVYNLETPLGCYSAQGIITHNCRCAWVPHLGIQFERRVNKLGGVKAAVKRGAKPKKKKATVKKKRPPVLTKNVFYDTGSPPGSNTPKTSSPSTRPRKGVTGERSTERRCP